MNGEITRYYKYKGTSGRVNVPPSVAKTLSWNHKDEIRMIFKTIDGQEGLFLFKKEER
ncbi:MAG: hypothetical protein ACFFAN_01505 [Promethearchaeota archaeon]